MSELEKAARMALEALQLYECGGSEYRKPAERAIAALTQAIATAEPRTRLTADITAPAVQALLAEKFGSTAEPSADGYEPAGFLVHWPAIGGGRVPVYSKSRAAGEANGCPVTELFKRGTQPATTERKGELSKLSDLHIKLLMREAGFAKTRLSAAFRELALLAYREGAASHTSPQVPEGVQRDAERYRKIKQGSAWPCAFEIGRAHV